MERQCSAENKFTVSRETQKHIQIRSVDDTGEVMRWPRVNVMRLTKVKRQMLTECQKADVNERSERRMLTKGQRDGC